MTDFGLKALWFSLAALIASPAAGQDWPQFRGPSGQGIAAVSGVPIEWSETENVRWKTPIAGVGWSSPVVSGGQIWLTTAIEDEGSLRAVCLDRETRRDPARRGSVSQRRSRSHRRQEQPRVAHAPSWTENGCSFTSARTAPRV